MINWLRNSFAASIILMVARVWLGYNWFIGGIGKLTGNEGFSAKMMIQHAINMPVGVSMEDGKKVGEATYPIWGEFLKLTTDGGNNTSLFDFMVPIGETLIGLGLMFGTLSIAAAFFALLMNFSFMFSGVISVNPLYALIEFFLLMGGFNSSKIGLDRWVTPWLRQHIPFLKKNGIVEDETYKAYELEYKK